MLVTQLSFKNLSGPTGRLKWGQYPLRPQGLSCWGTVLDESLPWALPKFRGPPPHQATLNLEILPGVDLDTSACSLTAAHKAAFSPAPVGGGSDTTWAPLGAWPLCPEDARLLPPCPGVKEPAYACLGCTDTPLTLRHGLTLLKFLEHDMLKKRERQK